ncbi:MAG: DUF2760 domain-containing protein [Candidatus Solibacter usitatus]|nr:DUF2760 domain-containing protein [Candidatus Solibacter usitatus]
MAFRAFFGVLGGSLPDDIARAHGYTKATHKRSPEPPRDTAPRPETSALQLLSILQRDARMLDFFMEDITAYSDGQVGSAVRNIHDQCRQTLHKHLKLAPVIDGVEGAFTKPDQAGALATDPAAIKFIGNLPPQGKPAGGLLRHKGWRADSVSLPAPNPKLNAAILAPAELEVE